MQTTGEQNYWKSPDSDETQGQTTETTQQPSQYAGYDLQEPVEERPSHPHIEPLSWEASEYVHSEKGFFWFVVLGVATLGIAAVAYFLLKSWTFTILVFVMAAATAMYANRPPRSLHYELHDKGLSIEDRHYHYEEFRGFAIVKDGPLSYVMLLPIKRFMPAVTLYFPPEEGERIVNVIGSILPIEQRELDWVERTVRKVRF